MIDTFVIFYKTSNYNTKDVLSLPGVIRELTRKDFDGNLRLCVKPSLFIKKYSSTESSNNKVLCNLKEALLVKYSLFKVYINSSSGVLNTLNNNNKSLW